MKLHALGLQQYDAVLVVDNDFAPAGPWSDFGPLFDCAAAVSYTHLTLPTILLV